MEPSYNTKILNMEEISCLKNIPLKIKKISTLGNETLLSEKKILFSGSRSCSNRSLEITSSIINRLEKDTVIVSGFAIGIDRKAIYHALDIGLKVIIFLPYGISEFISHHSKFLKTYKENNFLIISQFPEFAKWSVSHAFERSRLSVVCSDYVIIPEGKENGGTFFTGKYAIELNKPTFVSTNFAVVPNGNKNLINLGAKNIEDFLK